MKIAIQTADLDNKRIDGTRVYLWNVLKYFGELSQQDDFFIYHKSDFNPELTPKNFPNYKIRKIHSPLLWTQTGFAWGIRRDEIDALWMPMHNIPVLKPRRVRATVTIHDLAFKLFPETFPKSDLRKLNRLTDLAILKSDKIIAVSNSTKKDILKFYPQIGEEKIRVIYHGFDRELFRKKISEDFARKILSKWSIKKEKYFLYVGAIQPRKNLPTLVKAFDNFKKRNNNSDWKLVLAGGKAWRWQETLKAVEDSPFKDDIILTGRVSFDEVSVLFRNAGIFVFPSLYEGFGIPILEAFAAGVPVISADNSSLKEVGGDGAEYFNASNYLDLSKKMEELSFNTKQKQKMIMRGKKRLAGFSWRKCAEETLNFLKK